MSREPRRPRRAVRPPGTVGADESVLRSVLPALSCEDAEPGADSVPDATGHQVGSTVSGGTQAASTTPARSSAQPGAGTDDLWRATRSADDSDRGWGREEPTSNDDRLRREKPPHW